MAEVLKKRRLVNPARRRRNQEGGGIVSRAEHAAQSAIRSVERAAEDAIDAVQQRVNRGRRRNVGEILTVLPANPGRKRRRKNVAATKRKRNRARANRARNRPRRSNRARVTRRTNRVHRRRSNPQVVVRYRTRRHNRRYNRGRRRNPEFLSGDAGKVASVLGGALVTSTLTGFLPSNLTTGTLGYVTTAVTAVVGGTILGKVMKNRQLGNWFTVGGLVIVGLQLIQQFMPSLQLPFTTAAGTSGMGLITGSSFYTPQVNQPGSMASFYLPAAIPTPVVAPTGMSGLGQYQRSMRRVGRMR